MRRVDLSLWAERIRQALLVVFLADWGLVWLRQWASLPALAQSRWPEGFLVVLATATTLGSLTRQLPAQNVMVVPIVIGAFAGLAHSLGAVAGVPFGPYIYTRQVGQLLFYPLPWAVPMVWIVFVLTARGVARLILRPWRQGRNYGFWLLGMSVFLVVLLDFSLEPFAARVKQYWLWNPTKTTLTWYGAPWVNFLGWSLVAGVILAFVTPWLINKRPAPQPSEYHSLLVWCLLNALFATGALVHQLWPAAIVSGAAALVVAAWAGWSCVTLARRVCGSA